MPRSAARVIRNRGGALPDRTAPHQNPSAEDIGRQRVDRWLWHARVVRTREAAASLVGSGYIRINGVKIDAPGRFVRAGDVITVALDRSVRVLKVMGFVERRGPARADPSLYEDLT